MHRFVAIERQLYPQPTLRLANAHLFARIQPAVKLPAARSTRNLLNALQRTARQILKDPIEVIGFTHRQQQLQMGRAGAGPLLPQTTRRAAVDFCASRR